MNHRSLRPFPSVVSIFCLLLGSAATAQPIAPEVRATWLTTTGPDAIGSGFNTEATVAELRRVGVNTLYTEAWKNGYTQFESPTIRAFSGVGKSPRLRDRDLLEEVGIQAHRNNQLNFAWFEYGFAAEFVGHGGEPLDPLGREALRRGWLLKDQAGRFGNASNGFAWMNPAVPEVRQLLVGMTLDAIRGHDLDGVQFDDRLAWPEQFGFDDTTARLYREETGRSLPSRVDETAFRAWRQSKVTAFARELSAAVRAERPDLQLSVSPSVTGFSDVRYNAVWTDWLDEGLFDEYVPQVYRSDLDSFRTSLTANVAPFVDAGRLDELVVGLRLNGTGADTDLDVLKQQIVDVALAAGGDVAGHSIFYSKGILENADELASFYGDQRDNPFFDADRRPDPIVATETPDGWSVEVGEGMTYRVVAEIAGRWREIESRFLDPGTVLLNVAGASEVELLVDRRFAAVPEPAIGLLLGGLVVAGLRRRRVA